MFTKEGIVMSKGKWNIILVITIVSSFLLLAGRSYAARDNVIIAKFTWPGAEVISEIMKLVLEDKLKIPVELKIMQQAACWAAMEKGSVDVHPDIWYPMQAANIEKYVEERKAVETTISYEECRNGFVIPTWVAQKYGIKNIEDLNQHTKLFDLTGDGKGDIWGGGFGWYVTEMTKYKIRDYGLNYDQLVLEQYAFMTILVENMRRKKPILFVFWTPEWPFAVYDLSWVDEPPYDPEKYKFVPGKPDESYVASADKKTLTYVGYSKKMKERLPRAYKFFKNWHISGDDVSKMLAEVQDIPGNPKKDPLEVAKKWVADHQDIVNEWVTGIE